MGKVELIPEGPNSGTDPWAINGDVLREVEEAKTAVEKSRREFEDQIVECPFDGSNSTFIRYQGAYTRGWAIFRCEKKAHEFQVG